MNTGNRRNSVGVEETLQGEGKRLLGRFDWHMRSLGHEEGTRKKYRQNVAHFIAWLNGRDPVVIKRQEIREYLEEWQQLYEEKNIDALKPRTVKLRVTALRALYDYLDSCDLLVDETGREIRNPMDGIKTPKIKRKPNDWLREEEDQRLLKTEMNRQERIVIFLFRWSAMRVSEGCALLWADIDFQEGRIRVRQSKSDSGLREIPMAPQLETELRAWMGHLRSRELFSPELPVLVTRNRTAMKPTFVWRLVKRVAKRADVRQQEGKGHNISAVTPHTLRRTFGSDLLNKDLPLEHVSKLLGHANISVTQECYAELLDKTVEKRFYAVLSA